MRHCFAFAAKLAQVGEPTFCGFARVNQVAQGAVGLVQMFAVAEAAVANRVSKFGEGLLNLQARAMCEAKNLHAGRIYDPGLIVFTQREEARERGRVFARA